MMENVLHSAVSYGAIEGVSHQISNLISSWKAAWSDVGARNAGTAYEWSALWIKRLSGTREMLDRLTAEAR